MFTGDAALISFPCEAGVVPKKIQKAFPGGQNANSPSSKTSRLLDSSSAVIGIEKYISPLQRLASPSIGSASAIDLDVGLSLRSAST